MSGAAARRSVADVAGRHPRHLGLMAILAGLLVAGRMPAVVVASAAILVAVGAMAVPLTRRPIGPAVLAALLLGAAWGGQERTAALEATRLAPDLGRVVAGPATVVAPPRADPYGGARALVRWRGEPVLLRIPSWWLAREGRGALPRVGDVLNARGRLRPPGLAEDALHAHAGLRATDLAIVGRRGGALGVVDGVRRRAERVLDGRLPVAEAALLKGMALGDDAAMPDDVRDAFIAASLSHLTAASGQNIMLLAALVVGMCVAAGVGVRARWALTLALIIMYVPLAGGGASIQRAGIMGAATIAAALAGRPASRWYALLLAAALTLALDPRAVGDAGWQLSFAAVVGIALLAAPARARLQGRGLPPALAEACAVTAAATIATAPLIALTFERSSLVALPANVAAAPAVAPIMWLGLIATALGQIAPPLASPFVALAGPPLGYLVGLARLAAGLPGAAAAIPPLAVATLCALAAVLVTAPRGDPEDTPPALATPRRRAARRALFAAALTVAVAAALVPAVLPPRAVAPPPDGTLRVTAIDIGQGDATLLQAGGHAVLVDAGPPGAGIVDRLRRAGARRLDALVVTHAQADHEGGAPAVLAQLDVDLVLDGRGGERSPTSQAIDAPLRRRLRAGATRVVGAQAGQTVRAGPLTLRVLWPPATPGAPGADPNDRAVVALASAYGATALLTADAESHVLAPLDLGPVDVLKVSHHGSADDGLAALLDRVRPRVALIEVGAHNTYGHPTPSTLRALRAAVPIVRRTDQDGTVRVDLRGGAAHVAATR